MVRPTATRARFLPRRAGDPPVAGGEVGVLGPGRGGGGLAEGPAQPGVARAGAPGEVPAGGLVVAGAYPCPGGKVGRGGEAGHVPTGLGEDHLGGALPDAGDGDQQLDAGGETGGSRPRSGRSSRSIDGVCGVDAVQHQPASKAWWSVNRPVSASVRAGSCGRIRPLARSASTLRVALPGDQRLEHRPAGDAQDVAGHAGQLDPGVLQHACAAAGPPGSARGSARSGSGSGPAAAGSAPAARSWAAPGRARPAGRSTRRP